MTASPLLGVPDLAFGYAVGFMLDPNWTWTNQPAAITEFLGDQRRRFIFDLSKFRQYRLSGQVVIEGATNSQIWLQAAQDDPGPFSDLDAQPAGSNGKVPIDTAGIFRTDGFRDIATVHRSAGPFNNGVVLRVVGENGDGVADPSGSLFIEFR